MILLNDIVPIHIQEKMIRQHTQQDLETVLDIWLEASIKAHDFVAPEFWKSQVRASVTFTGLFRKSMYLRLIQRSSASILYMKTHWLLFLYRQSVKVKVLESSYWNVLKDNAQN